MEISKINIILALQTSLLGEIYGNIRVIAFKYDPDKKYFVLRYYLDKEPTEHDYENIKNVMAEFISNFKYSAFDKIDEECIYTTKPISQIDIMDGMFYCRKEN